MADDRPGEPIDAHARVERPSGIVAHTLDGRVIFANETFAAQQGVPADQVASIAPYSWTVGVSPERISALVERIVASGHMSFDTKAPSDASGTGPWRVESWAAEIAGEPAVVSVRRDMSEERRTAQKLEFRSMLLDQVSDAVICHTLDGQMVYVNEAACRERGYTHDEFMGLRLDEFITNRRREHVQELTQRLQRDGAAVFESEDVAKDGRVIPVEVHARLATVDGVPVIVSVVRNVSERKHAEAEIEKLAYYDTLTGLPNRRLFMDRLGMALAHARRQNELLAVVFVDLDHLKRVNDQMGHSAGDRLLLLVGQRLAGMVRVGDTVARISGDEFVILLPGLTYPGDAERIVRKVLSALREPFEIHGSRISATVSMGVALNDERDMSDAQLLANADNAMYSVKSTTRNAYAVYSKDMSVSTAATYDLQSELEVALDEGEFVVFYQPQVRLADRQVECVEALVRWRHPIRGLVEPHEFMSVAEETGLVVRIDDFVLREACRQHHEWVKQGLPRIRMAVNVSLRALARPGFDVFIAGLLGDCSMPPDFLELEVAERDALRAHNGARNMIELLHSGGVRIAVDGFASGYAAPNHLHGLPVDTLKINPGAASDQFVGDALASAVLSLADALALKAVVEYVETEPELRAFTDRPDLCAQGFVFCRPSPPEEIAVAIRNGYPIAD